MKSGMRRIPAVAAALAGLILSGTVAWAQNDNDPGVQDAPQSQQQQDARIKNPVAEFTGLDKITGRTMNFDVYMDETVQFGALQVTPRVCYDSPKEQEPKTDAFVEVDEITLDRKIRRIFTGWMLAQSPGLNAVEHPVYDVWLKDCKQKSDVPPPKADSGAPTKAAKPAAGQQPGQG